MACELPGGSLEYLHCDPALHLGQIDSDTTFTFPCTHVNRRPARRLAQPPLNLRLRVMARRTVVSGRRTYVAFRLHHIVPLNEARVRLDYPARRTAPLHPMRRRRVLHLGWICSACACEPSSHRVEPRLEERIASNHFDEADGRCWPEAQERTTSIPCCGRMPPNCDLTADSEV